MAISKTTAIVRLLASIAILGGVIYLSAFADPAPDAGRRNADLDVQGVKRVGVASVEAAQGHREVRFPGVTRAAQRARLGFTIGGRVVERPMEVGQEVAAGTVLARLDQRELHHAVSSARAALAELAARHAQTERDHARARQLFEAKAATREEVEKTEAALEALGAAEDAAAVRLAETERLLEESVLVAPFAGVVTDVLLEAGETAGPGQPVVVLSGDGAVELEVEVPESILASVRPGDAVTVDLPHAGPEGRQVPGTIRSVGRSAAGRGRLFPIVAHLEDADVFAGMTAELVLSLQSRPGLSVPVEAVVNPGGRRPAVYRVTPRTPAAETSVEKLGVEVGTLLGDRVLVFGDLAAGDRVVISGQLSLLDGERVEVR